MIRVRVAPSPTGDPHVGTAYIALFNLCFARQQGGKFILRIEDTDQVRSTAESEQVILSSLRWLGLDWDEGPDVGGPFGPYRQSERAGTYAAYAQQLIDQGDAFYCYRTPAELDELRNQRREQGIQRALKASDLQLSEAEIAARKASGAAPVVRMRVPEEGICLVRDRLRGVIELDWANVDAQVLLKADGLPTYHLANVVDDHLMQITHVIRGEEWINSAPKHILLYQYFGWDMPELCHMPLLRNPDKSKLSKRKNPTSINYYRDAGILPEALLNYLARMGWSMPGEAEKFTLEQMISHFDIDKLSLGGPVFDQEKLHWLNGMWIRENLSPADFMQRYWQWALPSGKAEKIVGLLQQRVETFGDLAPLAATFFTAAPRISAASFTELKLGQEDQIRVLQFSSWALDQHKDWHRDGLYGLMNQLAEGCGIKLRDFLQPLFVAIGGSTVCPPLFDSMEILGADLTRVRVRLALEALGGVSKKQTSRLEKDYRTIMGAAE